MRSLLTFGNTLVSCFVAMGLCATVSRGETITWIDPPETRSIGVAEASGAKSLDVDHATVTRGSLAALATPGAQAMPMAAVTPGVAEEVPLAVKTAVSTSDTIAKTAQFGTTLPWLVINSRPATRGIDPYPSWNGALLVVDDVTSVRAQGSDTSGYQASARGLAGTGFAMVGDRVIFRQ